MNRTHILAAALCAMALTGAHAQQPVLSPQPQQATWGEMAFAHDTPIYMEGAGHADPDAVALLRGRLDGRLTPLPKGAVRLVIGEAGDKAVKASRTHIPAQAEGY